MAVTGFLWLVDAVFEVWIGYEAVLQTRICKCLLFPSLPLCTRLADVLFGQTLKVSFTLNV